MGFIGTICWCSCWNIISCLWQISSWKCMQQTKGTGNFFHNYHIKSALVKLSNNNFTFKCSCIAYTDDFFFHHLKRTVVNLDIKKNEAKVVDQFDVEDIGDKKVYCRCWRSSKVCVSSSIFFLLKICIMKSIHVYSFLIVMDPTTSTTLNAMTMLDPWLLLKRATEDNSPNLQCAACIFVTELSSLISN